MFTENYSILPFFHQANNDLISTAKHNICACQEKKFRVEKPLIIISFSKIESN